MRGIASTQRLLSMSVQISMSAKGNAYDNAKAESFFKTLKQEEVYLKQYQTFEEASTTIGQFIEDVYNTKRLHSSLGYVPPLEFETAYFQDVRSVSKGPLQTFLILNTSSSRNLSPLSSTTRICSHFRSPKPIAS